MTEHDRMRFHDLTDEDIRRAIAHGHALRNEFIAAWGRAFGRWLSTLFKPPAKSTSPKAGDVHEIPPALHAEAGVKPLLSTGPGRDGTANGERYKWTA